MVLGLRLVLWIQPFSNNLFSPILKRKECQTLVSLVEAVVVVAITKEVTITGDITEEEEIFAEEAVLMLLPGVIF